MLSIKGWLQSRAYDLWIGLKPSRFGVVAVLLLAVLLMEPWTEQGHDVLVEYGSSGLSEADLRRRAFLYLFVFCFAILTWFFCRESGRLRFAEEEKVLLRYRQEFPRLPFDPSDPEQKQAIADDAKARLKNIRMTRVWAPRILGVAVPLVVALAMLRAAGWIAWPDITFLVVLAILVSLAVIPRRRIQNWLAKWLAKKNLPKLSKVVD
ncbi:MAG: hypothetical protein ACR2OF_08445, partial [Hyphomicrobium sp.]